MRWRIDSLEILSVTSILQGVQSGFVIRRIYFILRPFLYRIPYSINWQFLRTLPANFASVGAAGPTRHISSDNRCFVAARSPDDMIGGTKDSDGSHIQRCGDVHGSRIVT